MSLTNEVGFHSPVAASVFVPPLRSGAEQRGAAGLLLLALSRSTSALLLM